MVIIIIAAMAALGLGGLAIRQLLRQQTLATRTHAAAMRERETHAEWAGATVVSIISEAQQHDQLGSALLEIQLKIQPPEGEPYTTRTRWEVDMTARPLIQPGAQLPVKIDTQDPKVVYPNIGGAAYSPF